MFLPWTFLITILLFSYLPWCELLHHVFPSIVKSEANISLFFTPTMACIASATSPHRDGVLLCHGPRINGGQDNRLEFEISSSSIIAIRYLIMVIIKLTLLITFLLNNKYGIFQWINLILCINNLLIHNTDSMLINYPKHRSTLKFTISSINIIPHSIYHQWAS